MNWGKEEVELWNQDFSQQEEVNAHKRMQGQQSLTRAHNSPTEFG